MNELNNYQCHKCAHYIRALLDSNEPPECKVIDGDIWGESDGGSFAEELTVLLRDILFKLSGTIGCPRFKPRFEK